MNKAYLKKMWGAYADTDKLVDDIMALLTKYSHRNSEHGVCVMLNEYFTNKKPLIELLSKSPNYKGDLRIVLQKEFEREERESDVRDFCVDFVKNVGASKILLKTKDEHGKTIGDYLKVNFKVFNAKDLHDADFASTLSAKVDELRKNIDNFDIQGYTKESRDVFERFDCLIDRMKRMSKGTLNEEQVSRLKFIDGDLKLAADMKTSRAFNRICTQYGIHKAKNYNKLFAKYADLVSMLTRKLQFVISVNPCDYLTMSFGNSWSSCHTIDKENKRGLSNGYQGMYCAGTQSYMLDGSSIITYCVDVGEDVQTAGKIYRNMFHFENGTLIQSRVYPQNKDGATDLYKKFRDFVQTEFSIMLRLEKNMWTIKKGVSEYDPENSSGNTVSRGRHYRDYTAFSECNVTYPSEYRDNGTAPQTVHIGHDNICTYCGDYHSYEGRLAHYDCVIPTEVILSNIDDIGDDE